MSKHQNYGALNGNGHSDETDSLVSDNDAIHAPSSSSLAGIVTIGALVTLAILLSMVSNHSKTNIGLLGTSRLVHNDDTPPEDVARYYKHQLVDHFDENNTATWSNRYYQSNKYFKGAGHPIIIIVGGEGALDHGMLYPFVTEVLAKRFGAAVIEIEHRYYGQSIPLVNATSLQLLQLLTPAQAMADMVQLTKHVRDTEFTGCSPHRTSPDYCPVITVGASYPGFLSFLFRIVHGDFVDIAYASSAPLLMYAQVSDPNSYYDIVTSANDVISPGCSQAIRTTMDDMVSRIDSATSLHDAAASIGVCPHHLPSYISTKEELATTILDTVKVSFAAYNSENYPPTHHTSNYKACRVFQNTQLNTKDTLSLFFQLMLLQDKELDDDCDMTTVECNYTLHDFKEKCFDFGAYDGDDDDDESDHDDDDLWEDGMAWTFQTCTDVIFFASLSNTSFLPPHKATFVELNKRCQQDFGVTPHPTEMVDTWNYVNKLNNSSHILFVNGLQDMWAGGSVLWNVSETVVAINIEDGAHHSDLSHEGPTDQDTDDVKQAYVEIETILKKWLNEIQVKQT
jgi:hypothetical protein